MKDNLKLLGECLFALYVLVLYAMFFLASFPLAVFVGVLFTPVIGILIPFAAFSGIRESLRKREGCLGCFDKLKKALKFK